MKRIILLLIVGLLLIGCSQGAEDVDSTPTADAPATPPTPRPTRAVQEGATVLADGQLVAVNPPVSLSFEANGRLLELHVKAGDVVAKGDLIATLDDSNLSDAIINAELQVAQAELSLAQAQLTFDDLNDWKPEETAVALAEANLAAAEASLGNAETHDASAGNSLTSARVSLDQARRNVADAQAAYDTAHDPGRDWEYHTTEATCFRGEGGPVPCSGPSFHTRIKNEREGAVRSVEFAKENLTVAQAQYNLTAASVNNDTAVTAQASVVNAQQTLLQTTTGPKEKDIAVAQLSVDQAELSLRQSQLTLEQAQNNLENSQLLSPGDGTILTIEASPGGIVGAGVPIATMLDIVTLQFHTNNLSERDLAQIEPGQSVKILLKTYANEPIEGQVTRIASQAGGTLGDAAVFAVIIDLTNTADLNLRPGMTGRVEISNK